MDNNYKIIRTSAHSLSFCNKQKLLNYKDFLSECRRVMEVYVNYLWNTLYQFPDKDGNIRTLDIQDFQFDFPQFFDYNLIPVETTLSARAKSSLVTQCCGIVKGVLEKYSKQWYILNKLTKELDVLPVAEARGFLASNSNCWGLRCKSQSDIT